MSNIWHEKNMRITPNRVVSKMYNRNGFVGSVIIPTVMFPLSGKPEVFTEKNTEVIKDQTVLDAIDSIPYYIGRCYTNAEAITSVLRAAGYRAETYCGWLFTSGSETPIHHCWTVLDGKGVIDLADDFSLMLGGPNGEAFRNAKNLEERRELMVSFQAWAKSLPNSQRCMPVGTPASFCVYVGSPCNKEEGIRIYNNLIANYPNHPSHPQGGVSVTQQKMMSAGLMDWVTK